MMNDLINPPNTQYCHSSIGYTALERLLNDAKIYARVTGQEEIMDSSKKSSVSMKSTPNSSPYSARSSKLSSKSINHDVVAVDIVDEDGFRYIPLDLSKDSNFEDDFF